MHLLSTFSLSLFLATTSSTPLTPRAIATFPSGTAWDILLDKSQTDLSAISSSSAPVIDIDLFDNTANIASLANTKTVICYFSAGSREDWRPDVKDFGQADYGKAMGEWKGENWLNVTSGNVRAIMKRRIELAKSVGCHAVDPDNVDGYGDNHQDGYKFAQSVYAEYVNYLASVAHANGLAIGLKNAIDIIPDVLPNIQFTVNEQCHEMGECARYAPVTKKGLAVFNVEYGLHDCSQPKGVVLSTLIKNENQQLDTLGGQC